MYNRAVYCAFGPNGKCTDVYNRKVYCTLLYLELILHVNVLMRSTGQSIVHFSLGPAPRPGRVMVLMCVCVCVLVCVLVCVSVPPPEAWTFRYLLDTLDL